MWKKINYEAEILFEILKKNKLNITTVESCTGGMVSSAIVSINGSSEIFKNSLITYSNESKSEQLKIPLEIITKNGAVSKIVANLMAKKVLKVMNADVSISVTGIAGPTGGTILKPVGTVWIGVGLKSKVITKMFLFKGNRLEVRQQSTFEALKLANFTLKNL